TGSIGQSTVDLVASRPDLYRVVALTGHRNVSLLAQQARRQGAQCAVIGDEGLYSDLQEALAGTGIHAMAGAAAIVEAAQMPADWTMAAILGAAGLPATLAAIRRGQTVALANKESLVCAGPLMMAEVEKSGATLLPVDSEHN